MKKLSEVIQIMFSDEESDMFLERYNDTDFVDMEQHVNNRLKALAHEWIKELEKENEELPIGANNDNIINFIKEYILEEVDSKQ